MTVVLLLTVVAVVQLGAQQTAPRPISRIDLKQFGYLDPANRPPDLIWNETGYVAFLDSDTIVVAFSEFVRRIGQRPATLALLRAEDGKLIRKLDWQVSSSFKLMQGPDDKFLIDSGDELTLYSSGLEPLRRRDIGEAAVAVSPSGRTLLVSDRGLSSRSCESTVLQAISLKEVATWVAPCTIYSTVSDSAVAVLHEEGHDQWFLQIHRFRQEPQTIYVPQEQWCEPKPFFASDSVLVVNQPLVWFGCFEFLIMDVDGTIRHREPLDKYEHFENELDAAVSRNGNYLALVLTKMKTGFLQELGMARASRQRLLVYDLAHARKAWDLVLKPFPKQRARVALSPDGSRLALLRDGWLEIYPTAGEGSLAPSNSHPH
ncbi:MAG TPA: hypothetical protein VNK82_10885 [Terriglobales bacterium]|nr:hypothetical protein [Terriglobales bacterium]